MPPCWNRPRTERSCSPDLISPPLLLPPSFAHRPPTPPSARSRRLASAEGRSRALCRPLAQATAAAVRGPALVAARPPAPAVCTPDRALAVLCSGAGLPTRAAEEALAAPAVRRALASEPRFDSHLRALFLFLTVHIGVDKMSLCPLITQHPARLLPCAPQLSDDLRALRRSLAFHFDLFMKTSADELPEAWRAILRKRPDIVLVAPARAEAQLRWWAGLAARAGVGADTAGSLVLAVLLNSPGMLDSSARALQRDAARAWERAKEKRAANGVGRRGAAVGVGEAARATFCLAYIAARAEVLDQPGLEALRPLVAEVAAAADSLL